MRPHTLLGCVVHCVACTAPPPSGGGDATSSPGLRAADTARRPRTFANPLDLDYRFVLATPAHRTAADPLDSWLADYPQ